MAANFFKQLGTTINAVIRGQEVGVVDNKKARIGSKNGYQDFSSGQAISLSSPQNKGLKVAKSMVSTNRFSANIDVPPFYTYFLYYSVFNIVSTPVNRLARRVAGLEGSVYDGDGYEQPNYTKELKKKIKVSDICEEFVLDMLIFGQAVPIVVEKDNGQISFQLVPPHQISMWEGDIKNIEISKFMWDYENSPVTIEAEDFKVYRFPSVGSKFFGNSPYDSFYSDLNSLSVNRTNFQEFLNNSSYFGSFIFPDPDADEDQLNDLKESLKTLSSPGGKYRSLLMQGVKKVESLKQELDSQLSDEAKKQMAIDAAQAVGYHYKFLEGTTDGLGQGEQVTLMQLMKMDIVDTLQSKIADFFNEMILPAYFGEDVEKLGLCWKPKPMQTLSDLDQVRVGLDMYKEGAITAEQLKTRYAGFGYADLEYDDKFRKFKANDIIAKAGLLQQGPVAETTAKNEEITIQEPKEPEARDPQNPLLVSRGDEIQKQNIEQLKSFSKLDKALGLELVENYKSGLVADRNLDSVKATDMLRKASYGFKRKNESYNSQQERQKNYINNLIGLAVLDNVKAHKQNKESVNISLKYLERDINSIINSYTVDNKKATSGEVLDEVAGTNEEDFLMYISLFDTKLEQMYNTDIFPYLLEIERTVEAKITALYNQVETDSDGFIVFNETNQALLDEAIAEILDEQQEAIRIFLELYQDELLEMPRSLGRDLLGSIGIEDDDINYGLIDFSFRQGLLSNIGAYFENEFRRVRERMVDTFTQGVKPSKALQSMKPLSFNKNVYKTSAVEHSKGLFRAVIREGAKLSGINHFRAYIPTKKIQETLDRPNSETLQTLFMIKTENEWNKLGNSNPNVVGGLGLHHNSSDYYLPIPNNKLMEAKALTNKLRNLI